MHDIFDAFFKQTVGLDRFFSNLERLQKATTNFPAYNLIVDDLSNPKVYTLEVALAGYSKSDLDVYIRREAGTDVLVIKGEKVDSEGKNYVQRGLAARSFTREFIISTGVTVDSVEFKDGILTIKLTAEQQEEKLKRLPIL